MANQGDDMKLTPAEYGEQLARERPPLSDEQIEQAARILTGHCPRPALDRQPPPVRRCALYRHFDEAGTLLYVGISHDEEQRTRSHRKHSAFMEFATRSETAWYDTRDEALTAEREAIASEVPLFNRVHADEDRDRRLFEYLIERKAYHLLQLP